MVHFIIQAFGPERFDKMTAMLCRSSATSRPAPDAVSDALHDVRLSAAAYGRYEMTAPWAFAAPPNSGARFHLVVEGGYWIRAAASAPVLVGAGDVVLLPDGAGHALADPLEGVEVSTRRLEELPLEQLDEATYLLRARGSGRRSVAHCCMFDFEASSMHPLLKLLPEVVLLRGGADGDPSLALLLESIAAELRAQRVGATEVATRIADIVVTRVLRAWAEGRVEETIGWLGALSDPLIGRALAEVHRDPGQAWSVESLAALTNLSRSAFSERFAAAVGEPPAHYVARWRMHVAGGWLRHNRHTVAEVAERLGYESEASFSRAFKRVRGVPPGAFRRPERDETQTAAA
jgi:AraC-like DNA-binding protein